MLRFSLLLLCCSLTPSLRAKDRMETMLPRAGQLVDLWNDDLTQKIGRTRVDIREDKDLYSIRADDVPTLHFLRDEGRFSVPGVAATGKAEEFNEQGVIRYVFRGAQSAGAVEKQALVEVIRLDDGRCQLSWKLAVTYRGERKRQDEGGMAYGCRDEAPARTLRRDAIHLLPRQG